MVDQVDLYGLASDTALGRSPSKGEVEETPPTAGGDGDGGIRLLPCTRVLTTSNGKTTTHETMNGRRLQ